MDIRFLALAVCLFSLSHQAFARNEHRSPAGMNGTRPIAEPSPDQNQYSGATVVDSYDRISNALTGRKARTTGENSNTEVEFFPSQSGLR